LAFRDLGTAGTVTYGTTAKTIVRAVKSIFRWLLWPLLGLALIIAADAALRSLSVKPAVILALAFIAYIVHVVAKAVQQRSRPSR
jgi:hypothetical protein